MERMGVFPALLFLLNWWAFNLLFKIMHNLKLFCLQLINRRCKYMWQKMWEISCFSVTAILNICATKIFGLLHFLHCCSWLSRCGTYYFCSFLPSLLYFPPSPSPHLSYFTSSEHTLGNEDDYFFTLNNNQK